MERKNSILQYRRGYGTSCPTIRDYGILRPSIPDVESSTQRKAKKSKEKTSQAARQALFKTALDGLATYKPPTPELGPQRREKRV